MEETILRLCEEQPKYKQLLEKIVQYEKKQVRRNSPIAYNSDVYWEWHQIKVSPAKLNFLVTEGILKIIYKSNKSTTYKLEDREKTEKALKLIQIRSATVEEKETQIPPNLFDVIIGYEEIKEIFNKSIQGEKPIHILMVGPPASAKSLFLLCLSRLPDSVFALGSSSSKAGLTDLLLNQSPRFIILDEIDKISSAADTSTLLSLMEQGIVTETKFKRHETKKMKTWVFASANRINKMPKELLSRFLTLYFKEYSEEEFLNVGKQVLTSRENCNPELAEYIAKEVRNKLQSKDVRDCVKLARLCKDKGEVDKIMRSLLKYHYFK